jgi:autotransporter-associated beta strand protein
MSTTYNTYPGDTVNPGYFGINGALIVGDGTGAANTARYTTGTGTTSSELINYTSSLTLYKDGQVNLNASQTFTGVTFNGGAIDLGTSGGLYLNDTVTVNASAGNTATITGTGTSTISLTIHQGPVPVPNANRTFNIVGGVGNTSDLTLNAVVNNGSITKTGIGTMSIINSNFGGYEGTTTINNGILNIQHGDALGQASNNTDTATTVNSGGTLQLSNVANGNFTSNSGEQLYLNGTGYLNNGALQNLAGNNTWSGSTFLTTDARIQSESGSLLTLTGTMNSASNSTLDVRGAGDTTISGTVGTGSGGITKNGTGTLILSGTNTYSGTTLVQEGVLSLQNSAGLGGLGTTTVSSGAALHLDSTAHGNLLGGDATTISGTGVSGTGAIRNVLGANNYTGQITLAGSALVTANNATTLTLSGGTTGANQDLTVGTTAQNGNVVISGAMTNGTGQLTKEGSGDLTFGKSTGITGTVGLTHLNAGTLTVGLDTGTLSTLNTKAIDSALGTTLKIGSSGKVLATYDTDATMFGTIDEIAASGGTFEKAGAGTLTFATSFNFAGNLILSGGTLALINGANVTFGNIYITQNMTIDFGSGTSTVLSSANLFISAGVQVSVINWVNNGAGGSDDIWYATSGFQQTAGPSATLNSTPNAPNTNPENQITFSGVAPSSQTSWVTVQGGQYYDHEIRPIPEPSTYGVLFFGACFGLFGWRRFRRARGLSPTR